MEGMRPASRELDMLGTVMGAGGYSLAASAAPGVGQGAPGQSRKLGRAAGSGPRGPEHCCLCVLRSWALTGEEKIL